ncbi:CHRD domain protein [Posidoniimonas polymericola]|uniref:CHRD domain protein n=1 Tax=Posidoniimonas polymericola TaxID=2528002 RepID=A0A5C5YTD5_9BACT|nr:CHRD domain-containing protein [Posidoniimonas polymericola]TWT77993.1 CHRD domain protein [Posidoniimonas polymericola]
MISRSLPMLAIVAALATPLASSADHLTEWTFPLSTAQANPPAVIPSGDPLPTGMASVIIDSDAMSITWDVDYQDLTGPIVSPGAHFHGPAMLGSNAGVQIFLTDGDPPEPASGNLSGMASLTSQQLDDVLSGLWYLNVHTEANPAGELRAQVMNVPEPASAALIAAMGAMAFGIRRRA